jgi:hypothetical protein
MATHGIADDTRQALHLELVEDNTLWLDNGDDEHEDEYHSDPASIAERNERENGFNSFGHPIN